MDAKRALGLGLISQIVEAEALESAGRAMANDMLKTSPMGLRLTKEGLRLSIDAGGLEAAVALEDRGQILCASSGFFDEGIAAFLEQRDAEYPDD
ncbi:MAG: enoyl-CoA hydratase/carnithine racemase [Gammaproteobacteria bacterium]